MNNSKSAAPESNPVVSVIVPAYNAEKYLGECASSILAQSFCNLELILVDDESSDSTGALCDRIGTEDPRVRVLHIPHSGLSGARNAGIDHARGEYVYFIDADDTIHPSALELMLRVAKESKCRTVISPYISAESCTFTPYESEGTPSYRILSAETLIEDMLYQKISNTQCGRLFSRTLFDGGLRFRRGIHYEDLDFSIPVSLTSSEIAVMEMPLYFYRQHSGSFMHKWSESQKDLLYVTDTIEKLMKESHPGLLRPSQVRRYSANYSICLMASAAGENSTSSECWKVVKNYRRHVLFNRNVRTKDRVGAILSYFGRNITLKVSKWIGKY